jgi:hypothetical protein
MEQLFSKPHFDASESAKSPFLWRDVSNVESFDNKSLTLSRKNKKKSIFRFGRSKFQNPQWKG